jgi:hypothetical protein
MAAASDVTFDVLLGGKISPQLLKSFKDLEELMKKQGATAKTINAVMGRAYKETFDGVAKEGKKGFDAVERSAKHTFTAITEKAREAQHKVIESFDKIKESMEGIHKSAERLFEFTGVSALIGAVGGALTIEELIKKGIEVHRERATQQEVLAGTLRGRGAGLQAPEWAEAAEKLAGQAHIGHTEAMKLMTRLAVSGRFKTAEEAQHMALALTGLGGGTAEGAEAARSAYGKASMMMMSGRIRGTAIGAIGGGSGLGGALLQQLSHDTGIPVADLAKQFAPAKVSKQGVVTGGALAGAKGIEALNKAILELGASRGMEMVQAHMKGMEGLFYRFGEHWEDFVDKIGEFVEKVISPIGEEINKLIDSINFSAVFEGMIEKGKEWGQLIKAVWDTIADSPVLTRIKVMWQDFWKAFTGGVELYGPYVETWKDNLHHELGTESARHMTEAGRQWVKATSGTIEGFIKGITDAFQWFKDNGKMIADRIWLIVEAFIFLKGIEIAQKIYDFGAALISMSRAVVSATIAVGTSESVGLIGALGLIPAAIAGIIAGVGLLLKTTSKDPTLNKLADLQSSRAQTGVDWASKQAALSEQLTAGAITPEQYKIKLDELQDAHEREVKALDAQIKIQDALSKVNDTLRKSSADLESQLKKTTGNDLVHFDAAITQTTQSLLQMSSGFGAMGGGGGMFAGGAAGGVTGAHFTEFGPAVAGDQPGGPTYDWNSYHHVGAWPGVTGPLRAGDVALGYGAQAKYHVSPGQLFTDEYGRTWRFADRSGSKDPFNVDVFKGAMGGIFRKPTRALIGESGPEAVLPLAGAGAAAAGLGGFTINVNVAGNAHDPEGIAAAVERVIRQHWRRAAVV